MLNILDEERDPRSNSVSLLFSCAQSPARIQNKRRGSRDNLHGAGHRRGTGRGQAGQTKREFSRLFRSDNLRRGTLECCSDALAKRMMGAHDTQAVLGIALANRAINNWRGDPKLLLLLALERASPQGRDQRVSPYRQRNLICRSLFLCPEAPPAFTETVKDMIAE